MSRCNWTTEYMCFFPPGEIKISVSHLRHSSLAELKGTHTQSNHIFANLSDLQNV